MSKKIILDKKTVDKLISFFKTNNLRNYTHRVDNVCVELSKEPNHNPFWVGLFVTLIFIAKWSKDSLDTLSEIFYSDAFVFVVFVIGGLAIAFLIGNLTEITYNGLVNMKKNQIYITETSKKSTYSDNKTYSATGEQ